jgi:hypothetical protein
MLQNKAKAIGVKNNHFNGFFKKSYIYYKKVAKKLDLY